MESSEFDIDEGPADPGPPPPLRGLDFDLVRAKRAEMNIETEKEVVLPNELPQPKADDAIDKPKPALSELGESVRGILFNPQRPHRHMLHFKQKLNSVLEATYRLPIGEWMEGSSTFFQYGRSRYVFPVDVASPPVIVMRSMDEVEKTKRESRNCVRVRCSPSMIKRIREGMRKSKKKEEQETNLPAEPISKPIVLAAHDDIDIFGDVVPTEQSRMTFSPKTNFGGPLFPPASGYDQNPPTKTQSHIVSDEQIKEILRKKAALREQQVEVRNTSANHQLTFKDDDFFPATEFGQKLDKSKFALDDDTGQTHTKKQKLGNEKQIFNQVMKRINKQ